MSKKRENHDGNAAASAAAFTRQMVRVGEVLHRAEFTIDRDADEDLFLTHINIKVNPSGDGGYLAIIKAETPEGRVVAFHDAPTLAETIVGVLDRLSNRSLKFREDRPYGQ